LGFATSKFAKGFGKLRPGAEVAFDGAMVEFSEMAVDATGGGLAMFAGGTAPIFEEFAVIETEIEGVGRETGGLEGGAPARKKI
jgi:hypothetical protein